MIRVELHTGNLSKNTTFKSGYEKSVGTRPVPLRPWMYRMNFRERNAANAQKQGSATFFRLCRPTSFSLALFSGPVLNKTMNAWHIQICYNW